MRIYTDVSSLTKDVFINEAWVEREREREKNEGFLREREENILCDRAREQSTFFFFCDFSMCGIV